MLRRLGFDALFLDPGVSGGSETVVRGLVPAVAAAAPALEIEVATSRRGVQALRAAGFGDFARLLPTPMDDDQRLRKLAVQQVLLPRLAARRTWNVVHSLANLAPVRAPVPLVLTLLDVIYLHHATMSRGSRLAIGGVVRRAAPRAAAVVTISEAMRREILATLPLDPAKVTTIHLGAGRAIGVQAEPAALRERLGLAHRRVVLSVGAKRPHKNQALLVCALPRLPSDVVLILAGHDDGEGQALRTAADRLGVADRVVQLDYVPDEDLEALYALAACVALPTRTEGFGLPVLEAMRRGAPVACSRIPVLQEVGGEAAVYFDPDDEVEAAEVIGRALGDAGLAARGRARAAEFTWRRAAERYLEVYERCASA